MTARNLEERTGDARQLQDLRTAVDTLLVVAYGPSTITFGDVSDVAREAIPRIQARVQGYLKELNNDVTFRREPGNNTIRELAYMQPDQVLILQRSA
jgi:hypothetical protein